MKMLEEFENRIFQVLFFEHRFLTYYFEPKYKTLGNPLKHSSLVRSVSIFLLRTWIHFYDIKHKW